MLGVGHWQIAAFMATTLFIAILISQIIKTSLLVARKKHITHFAIDGHFPSNHSALVTSLVFSIFIVEGFTTTFFVALVVALIIARDAVGVRNQVGILTKALRKTHKTQKINDYYGHTLVEMVGGIVIGILSSLLAYIYVFLVL